MASNTRSIVEKITDLEDHIKVFDENVEKLEDFVDHGSAVDHNGKKTYSSDFKFGELNILDFESVVTTNTKTNTKKKKEHPLLYLKSTKPFTFDDADSLAAEDKFCIIYAIAQNYLVDSYSRLLDDEDFECSNISLDEFVKDNFKGKKKNDYLDRLEKCKHDVEALRVTLKSMIKLMDEVFPGKFHRTGSSAFKWHEKMHVDGYKGERAAPKFSFNKKSGKNWVNIDHLFAVGLSFFKKPKLQKPKTLMLQSKSNSNPKKRGLSVEEDEDAGDEHDGDVVEKGDPHSRPLDAEDELEGEVVEKPKFTHLDVDSHVAEEEFEGVLVENRSRNSPQEEESTANPAELNAAIDTLTTFLGGSHIDGVIIDGETSNSSSVVISSPAENTPLRVRKLLFGLLQEYHGLKQKEFQVSIELMLRYVTYQQHFSKFFIMCESFPVAFAETLMIQENAEDAAYRNRLIKSSEVYLTKLASNLMTFFKQYIKLEGTRTSSDLVKEIFPTISESQTKNYCEVLDEPNVRAMIHKVTREDQMFVALCGHADFKTSRHYIFDNLVNKFCTAGIDQLREDDSKEYIISIMRNIEMHKDKVPEKKIKTIMRILEKYVDPANPFEYRGEEIHIRQLRSEKDSSILGRDYSGMDSSSNTGKTLTSKSTAIRNPSSLLNEGSEFPVAVAVAYPVLGQSSSPAKRIRRDAIEDVAPDNSQSRRTRATSSSSSSSSSSINHKGTYDEDMEQDVTVTVNSSISTFCASSSSDPLPQPHSSPNTKIVASYTPQRPTATPSPSTPKPSKANSSFMSTTTQETPFTAQTMKSHQALPSDPSTNFFEDYKFLLTLLSNDATNLDRIDQRDSVKRCVRYVLNSVVNVCADWQIDLDEDILKDESAETTVLTPETISFWINLWTNYQLSKDDASAAADPLLDGNGGATSAENGMEGEETEQEQNVFSAAASDSAAANASAAADPQLDGNGGTSPDKDMDEMEQEDASAAASDSAAANASAAAGPLLDGNGGATSAENGMDEMELEDASAAASDSATAADSVAAGGIVSSSARNVYNADTVAEISRVHHVADIVVRESIGVDLKKVLTIQYIQLANESKVDVHQLEASVLSVYLHAIRIHTCTRHYFLTRVSYQQLQFNAYVQHKTFLLIFENGKTSFELESVRNACGFTAYSGDRTVTKLVNHMFPEVPLILIGEISLPRKDPKNPIDSYIAIQEIVNECFVTEMGKHKDPSVLIIDFRPFDTRKAMSTVSDFPNRMVLTHQTSRSVVEYIYQTVGAVYKLIQAGHDKYAFRIISRGRGCGDFFLQEFFYDGSLSNFKEYAPLCYTSDGWDKYGARIIICDGKPISLFPSELVKPSVKGKRQEKYFLQGVVMCLNAGQEHARGHKSFPLSLCRNDPVSTCFGQTLSAREMRILENTSWLTDEIINAAMLRFMQALNFDNTNETGPVIISPFFFVPLQESLYKDPTATTRMAKETTMIVDVTEFREKYLESKFLWKHQNLFSREDWFFSIINYPNNSHWIFLAIHSGSKVVFVNDPLSVAGNVTSVLRVVEAYINLEAADFCNVNHRGDPLALAQRVWGSSWTVLPNKAPQQHDVNNCGVLCLIAFFRSMMMTIQPSPLGPSGPPVPRVPPEPAETFAAKWILCVTMPAIKQFRLKVKAMLLENGGDTAACNYFKNELLNYIRNNELLY